ncbi:hypothetical protein [Anatilimnocola floriformis]|nr:hypothetical protein [Anatilimnocola floriformis]
MKRLGQWQWLVTWSPLWLPVALFICYAFYHDFTGRGEVWKWVRENVLFW